MEISVSQIVKVIAIAIVISADIFGIYWIYLGNDLTGPGNYAPFRAISLISFVISSIGIIMLIGFFIHENWDRKFKISKPKIRRKHES